MPIVLRASAALTDVDTFEAYVATTAGLETLVAPLIASVMISLVRIM